MNSAKDQTTIVQCTVYKWTSRDLCQKAKDYQSLLLMA